MFKRLVKKFVIINIIILMLMSYFMFLTQNKVEATVEEGKFTADEIPYNVTFIKTSLSQNTSAAIDSNGNLWIWGDNSDGQLGNGTTTDLSTPIIVKKGTKFKEVSLSSSHVLAIDESGGLWAWGNNYSGQLGNGTTTDSLIPIAIQEATSFKKIFAGDGTSMAIDKSGMLWTWGDNMWGELGNGTTTDSSYPIRIKQGTKFKEIFSGEDNSFAIDESGKLWAWGRNQDYQLGDGTTNDSYVPINIMSDKTFIAVVNNDVSTHAIDSNGTLWGWGNNVGYSVGNGAEYDVIIQNPVQILSGTKFSKIVTNGVSNHYLIDEQQNLWGWGNGSVGQFGEGRVGSIEVPTKMLNGKKIKDVSCSFYNTCIIDENDVTWITGDNDDGQLGNGTTEDTYTFIQLTASSYTVTFMNGETVIKTETVSGGNAATAPTVTKTGYTLSWDIDFSNVTSNLTVNAVWTPKTNTSYKIEHYKQNVNLSGYTLDTTENLTGTTDATATATAKTYTGFSENTSYSERVVSGIISGDGSLVLKLYYDRNKYNVALNTNGGTINSGNLTSYTYGIGTQLLTDITKIGHTFGGWYDNQELTGTAITRIGTTDTGDKEYYAKWIINKYTVTFKDGTKTAKTETVEYGKGATAPNLTKPGYTLTWDKSFSNITGDLTVSSIWTANTDTPYKVEHYKLNTSSDGYELADTENLTGTTDTQVMATAKTYDGFIENTGYPERVPSGNLAGDGSLVLKLYYDRSSYTVKLNVNGGIINSGNVTSYNHGVEVTLPTNVTKTGYTFEGWYGNAELTGSAITKIEATESGNKQYYAKWTINQYTVTFKNGETVEKTETVEYGKSATAPELTKEGYTLSWDVDYSNITSDLTVNAVWTANTDTAYRVEHYKQNTSLNGYELLDTENLTGTTDTTVTAIAKTYTGFSENTEHREKVESGNVEGDGSLVLKLYYDRNTYTVKLNVNEGSIISGNVTRYTYGIETVLPTNVVKTGYAFGGWYNNSEFTGDIVTKVSETDTGNKEYYAKWTLNQCTVTFKNGTETVKTETVEYGKGATAPTLTKTGYTLSWDKDFSNVTSDLTVKAEWTANTNTPYKVEHYKQNTSLNGYDLADTENLTGTTDTRISANIKTYVGFIENANYSERVEIGIIAGDGSLVLKLYYDRNIYGVKLNTNGGTVNTGNVTNYTYGIEKIIPTDVTKEGYTFEGWYDNEQLTGDVVTKISDAEIGNKEYYAKWTINKYIVTFKDGDTVVKTETVEHGKGATASILTKIGYTLTWDKDFSNVTGDMTVNAIWTANTNTPYKVEHYKQNTSLNGYELAETEELTGMTGEQVIANAKTYAGFTENTGYTERIPSGDVVGDGSLVLKLYYDRNNYNVVLNTNDGTINSGSVTSYKYGIETTLPTDITKEGCIFTGWYDNSALTGTAITEIGTTETGDKAYYAKWTINQYTVTFKDGEIVAKTETVEHGKGATAPSLTKEGYTLTWDVDYSNIIGDLTVNAIWTANTNTSYKVEHYRQDVTLDGYTLFETENLTGITDTEITANSKTYVGFTENIVYSGRIPSGTITGDGSLVLKLYYDRNNYNVMLNTNEGTINSDNITTYTYGIEVTLPTDITKEGCIFTGWYDNSALTGDTVAVIEAGEIGDKTYYAKWVEEEKYYIRSDKYSINMEENQITKVSPDTKIETFINNIETNGTIKVLNLEGQEVTDEELVGTGYKIQVEFKRTIYEYEIAVRGDLDGNGKVTVTDLSTLNQILVKTLTVTGIREKAADIDYSDKVSVVDLSMINQSIVGVLKL